MTTTTPTMVYFPEQVFKNIISFIPRPTHPVAKMMKSQLGLWMDALRSNDTDYPRIAGEYFNEHRWKRDRESIFRSFFAPRWPGQYDRDPTLVYKQRHAGAKKGWTDYRPTVKRNPELMTPLIDSDHWLPEIVSAHGVLRQGRWQAELNPKVVGKTAKAMKEYLKMNKIKGYSNKKKPGLIKLCMSF